MGRKKTAGERLLRNTVIACGVLTGAMALSCLGTPWSERTLEAAQSAMTMRVDVAGALSRAAFVREIFPETALVFWNLGEEMFIRPVGGAVIHAWSEEEPYMEFACAAGEAVLAAADGRVETVSRGADGQSILCLSHADGRQTRYAWLAETDLEAGDVVESGDVLGSAGGGYMYFEVREDSRRTDPGELMPVMSH